MVFITVFTVFMVFIIYNCCYVYFLSSLLSAIMAFLGGITWKHSNYHGNARSMIPLNLGCDSFHLELPKNMRYLSSPEYADVVEVFMPFLNQEKFGEPDILVSNIARPLPLCLL